MNDPLMEALIADLKVVIGLGLLLLWAVALAYVYWWVLFAKRPPWS